jgi:hypothetical protein
MILFWMLVVAGFAFAIWSSQAKQKAKDDARGRYEAALGRLKSEPSSPDQRQITLELGRAYSNLIRDKKGNTVFDEVALMNDINAACAAVQVPATSPKSAASHSAEERLRNLQDLLTKGLIDDAEYAASRKEILQQI